jgi:small-conductance mechanosensitive channel
MRFPTVSGLLSLLITVLLLLVLPVSAQTGESGVSASVLSDQAKAIRSHGERVAQIEKTLSSQGLDDAKLAALKPELDALSREVLASAVVLGPRIREINARLDQLGAPIDAAAGGEPEAITTERTELINRKGEINALLGEAETVSVTIARAIDLITELRRDLFAQALSKRYVLTETLNTSVLSEFGTEMSALWSRVSSWFRFAVRFKLDAMLGATFLSLLVALVLSVGGRRLIAVSTHHIKDDDVHEPPNYFSRVLHAFWFVLLPMLALSAFLISTYTLYDNFGIFTGNISELFAALFNVIAVTFLAYRLADGALQPDAPSWRLLPIADRPASTLTVLITATALTTGLDFLAGEIAEFEHSPLSLTVAKSFTATILVGLLILAAAFVKPFQDADGRWRSWPRSVQILLVVMGAAPIIATLLGYIPAARFISQQIVVTGAILATTVLGFRAGSAIGEDGVFGMTRLGKWLRVQLELSSEGIDRLGMVAGIATNLLVVTIAGPLILRQWGFQWVDIGSWLYKLATEIRIGSFSFSLIGLLAGVLVFTVALLLTRWFQRWLDGTVMAKSRVDAGVRNSIRTAIGYAGVALAGVIGIAAAGIDLSNLAIVAGALSLGIGFGLQNIVSNFVSGLILLAERPFKAGDWIEAGSVVGTVKRINVRATEIETFQRQTIVLPNSELINAAVGNWTHKNKLGRAEVAVGVGYDSDPEQVRTILLEIARDNTGILKNPEPVVVFLDFGASSLDFELRFFLADIGTVMEIKTAVRFAIMHRFREAGIEIPFPQREVHLSKATLDILAGRGTAAETEPAKPAAKRRTPKAASDGAAVAAPKRRRKRSDYGDMD